MVYIYIYILHNIRNESQVNILRTGGNSKLKNFLQSYEMPEDQDKKSIYSSKLMGYYRRMVLLSHIYYKHIY